MKKNNVVAVIAAQEKNRYSEEGDLVQFGNLTLLEWKLTQLRDIFSSEEVWVTTPSDRVELVSRAMGVNVVRREKDAAFPEVIKQVVGAVSSDAILFANTTSPYLGSKDLLELIDCYNSVAHEYDSVVTVKRLQEYVVFRDKPLNYSIDGWVSRSEIEPLLCLTNGASIIRSEVAYSLGRQWGACPFWYEVDRLSSYEIKDIDDFVIACELLSTYYKAKEIT